MRSVAEWIGKTDDTPIPARVRLRVFERFEGRCQCGCDRKIAIGEKWDCDHKIALVNGGQHREKNLRPLLTEHHKRKSKDDSAIKKWNTPRRYAAAGINQKNRRPFPGSRSSPWKITFGHGVVKRWNP